MFRLCSLAILFSIFLPNFARAEQADLVMATNVKTVVGDPRSLSSGQKDSYEVSVLTSSERSASGLRISGGLIQTRNDYANYLIYSRDGKESSLGSSFSGLERQAKGSVDYKNKWFGLNVGYGATIGTTPFMSRQWHISESNQLWDGFSTLSFEFQQNQKSQPLSYYTDPGSAARVAYATQITSRNSSIAWEQIMSENWRARWKTSFLTQTSRPFSLGNELFQSFALDQSNFLMLDLSKYSDSHGAILDDRGYFDVKSMDLKYSHYLNYDWVISGSYGLVVEKEDNRKTSKITQLATDVFAVNLGYEGKAWKFEISPQYTQSNQNYKSYAMNGSMTWTF